MKPPAPVTNTLGCCGIQTFLRLEILYRIHYVFLLLQSELREQWKSKSFPSSLLRLWKIAFFVANVCKAFLQMQRNRIINFSRDLALAQVLHERVAVIGNSDNVLMKDVTTVRLDERRIQLEV